jgi:SAM-dependent methyltransferase
VADGSSTELLWRVYSRWYDRLWDVPLTHEVGRAVAGHLAPDDEVVEVGAGTGLISAHLLAARTRSLRVTEPDPQMRARLRARLPGVHVGAAALEELDVVAGRRRTVVAANVVHLLAVPERAVEHLRKVAGAQGQVIVVTPRPGVSLRDVVRAQRRTGSSRWQAMRFVLLHLLLAPLTALAGVGLRRERASRAVVAGFEQVIEVAGVTLVLRYRGHECRDRESQALDAAPGR